MNDRMRRRARLRSRPGRGDEPARRGQPPQRGDDFGALVGHQPGRQRPVRLGAGTAVDGDPHMAALDEQPGRAYRGEFIAPTPKSVKLVRPSADMLLPGLEARRGAQQVFIECSAS